MTLLSQELLRVKNPVLPYGAYWLFHVIGRPCVSYNRSEVNNDNEAQSKRWGPFYDTLSPGSKFPSKVAMPKASFPTPARIIPSESPNFICRGFRLAATITLRPTSLSGSG